MYSLVQPGVASDLIGRLAQLPSDAKAQWGKMSVAQMLAHCQGPLQVALGEKQLKRRFIGKLFGGRYKKIFLSEAPLKHGMPTDPDFVVKDQRDFDKERRKLQALLQRFARSGPEILVAREHPFFGHMTVDEWGVFSWKHLDHHLQQFNV